MKNKSFENTHSEVLDYLSKHKFTISAFGKTGNSIKIDDKTFTIKDQIAIEKIHPKIHISGSSNSYIWYIFMPEKYAKGGGVGKTKKDYVEYLNEIGVPEHDHPENGGRVTWSYINKYGEWLKKNDPIAFEVGYSEWKNEYAKGGSVKSKSEAGKMWDSLSGERKEIFIHNEFSSNDYYKENLPLNTPFDKLDSAGASSLKEAWTNLYNKILNLKKGDKFINNGYTWVVESNDKKNKCVHSRGFGARRILTEQLYY